MIHSKQHNPCRTLVFIAITATACSRRHFSALQSPTARPGRCTGNCMSQGGSSAHGRHGGGFMLLVSLLSARVSHDTMYDIESSRLLEEADGTVVWSVFACHNLSHHRITADNKQHSRCERTIMGWMNVLVWQHIDQCECAASPYGPTTCGR